jgi:predicted SnoaL-like aldol condensation-catalyzing enzyme
MEQQEAIVKDFLTLVIAGKIDEAYRKHINFGGTHHNLFTHSGMESLREGMKENESQFPNKEFTIRHIVSERDIVMTYSHLVIKPGDRGMVVAHVFRLADGKIVELWDCGQAIPDTVVNTDGAF